MQKRTKVSLFTSDIHQMDGRHKDQYPLSRVEGVQCFLSKVSSLSLVNEKNSDKAPSLWVPS